MCLIWRSVPINNSQISTAIPSVRGDPGLNPQRAATTTNGHPFTFQNSNRGICVYKSIKRINPHKNFQCMK